MQRPVERLRSGAFKSPWFLVLHLWELHLPRQVLPRFRARRFGRTPYDRAVASHSMPLNNETKMTEAERAGLGAWIKAGAPTGAGS